MDDDGLRAFFRDHFREDSFGLYDLPGAWDWLERENVKALATLAQQYWLVKYLEASPTESWAWEGLQRLLRTLLDRGEPIPGPLQSWALDVASGRRKPPHRGKGPPRKDDRDQRLYVALRMFVAEHPEVPKERAILVLADAMDMNADTVMSAIRKARRERFLEKG